MLCGGSSVQESNNFASEKYWENTRLPLFRFVKDFIYLLLREGKERRKRGRETSMCGSLSHGP